MTEFRCENCMEPLNEHLDTEGLEIGEPEEGDMILCYYCGELHIKMADGVEKVTDAVWKLMPPNVKRQIQTVRAAIIASNADEGRLSAN